MVWWCGCVVVWLCSGVMVWSCGGVVLMLKNRGRARCGGVVV